MNLKTLERKRERAQRKFFKAKANLITAHNNYMSAMEVQE